MEMLLQVQVSIAVLPYSYSQRLPPNTQYLLHLHSLVIAIRRNHLEARHGYPPPLSPLSPLQLHYLCTDGSAAHESPDRDRTFVLISPRRCRGDEPTDHANHHLNILLGRRTAAPLIPYFY
jgi:hypothetical protein